MILYSQQVFSTCIFATTEVHDFQNEYTEMLKESKKRDGYICMCTILPLSSPLLNSLVTPCGEICGFSEMFF